MSYNNVNKIGFSIFKKLSFLVFFTAMLFHDFIFLNIDYYGYGFSFFNAWKELVIILYIFFSCILLLYRGRMPYLNLFLYMFFLLLLMLYLYYAINTIDSVRFLRSILSPLIFPLVLTLLIYDDVRRGGNFLFNVYLALFFVACLYALSQFYFVKEMEDFWYYNPLVAKGFELMPWDSFRNGHPRISSFFTSSLEFSFYVVISIFFIWMNVNNSYRITNRKKAFSYFVVVLGVIILFLSTVRSAQIVFLYFTACLFLVSFFVYINRMAFWFLMPVFLVITTFCYLIFGFTEDLSAIGRITQWSFVFENLLNSGLAGHGFHSVGPGAKQWFDSYILNLLYSGGALFLIFFILFFYLFNSAFKAYKRTGLIFDENKRAVCFIAVVSMSIFVYASFFQAFFNSVYVYLMFFFVYLSIKVSS